jgi:hypothetical protein
MNRSHFNFAILLTSAALLNGYGQPQAHAQKTAAAPGQPSASTALTTAPAIAAELAPETSINAELSIEPPTFEPEALADDFHRQFESIDQQPCERLMKESDGMVYSICTVNQGGDGAVIKASSSVQEAEDGIGYWYNENGTVHAVRFFHTGELFVFTQMGGLAAELLPNRQVRMDFSESERTRLETLAQEGGNNILQRF